IYLVFAGMDRLLFEYEKKFVERNRADLEEYAPWYEIHVTKDANHIFSFREWEEDMLEQCCRWLDRLEFDRGKVVTRPKVESYNEISRSSA
ncbi:MAG: hypothetical protein ACRD5H_15590, partial [Nitrososphaerales archaeon]